MKIIQSEPKHAQQADKLIYQSGPVAFDYIFNRTHGPDVKIFLKNAFTSKQTMFSHQHHYIAMEQGQVLATLGIFERKQHDRTFFQNAKWIWCHYGIRSIAKGLIFELKLVKPPKHNCLYLCHIAVTEKQRGKGIASELISFTESLAIKKGIKKLSLDVVKSNTGARKLYERMGFKIINYRPSYNDTLDDSFYMEKTLL